MSPGKRKGRNRRGAGYSSGYGDDGYGGNNGSFQTGANPNRDRNGGGSGTGNFGGGNARQNANRGGRFGGGSEKPGGYFGFSTGPFGVMGDADTSDTSSADNAATREVQYSNFQDSLHEKLSSHPVESYAISQRIRRCDENTIEKDMKLSVNTHDTVEKGGIFPNAGLDDRMRGRSASCHIVKTSEHPSEFSGPIYKSCTMVDDDLEKTITVDQPSVRFRPCVANEQTEKLAIAASLDTFQKASCEVAYPPEKSVKSTIASSSHEINSNCGRGSATDDFGMLPQRRVRSMSQRISRSSCGEGYVKGDEQSVIQQFSVNGAEKQDGFPCDQEVRTVHHDENMNNCRLSKLSIHTNNDEFFFVGGHPPTDGRASLRSRRSLSRNSTSSSEFLPSYVDAHNNQSSGIPVADNGQYSTVYDMEEEAPLSSSKLSSTNLDCSDAKHTSVHSVASSGHPNTPVTSNLDSFGAEPERRENSCSQNNIHSNAHSISSKDPSTLQDYRLRTYAVLVQNWTVHIVHLLTTTLARVFLPSNTKLHHILQGCP
ncbi:hypothetical protein KIN20_037136 [Parelaphostrongylus tenuis]|uniref:Uncharacterized protein n=1 Tax=Parelaphostrongylus tenuis TaxID=148309 RepID=A0AAD5REC2_PARTN|nr:hypothetical protein KIN20_037136 [Parelaphostrongylus tenuis]